MLSHKDTICSCNMSCHFRPCFDLPFIPDQRYNDDYYNENQEQNEFFHLLESVREPGLRVGGNLIDVEAPVKMWTRSSAGGADGAKLLSDVYKRQEEVASFHFFLNHLHSIFPAWNHLLAMSI